MRRGSGALLRARPQLECEALRVRLGLHGATDAGPGCGSRRDARPIRAVLAEPTLRELKWDGTEVSALLRTDHLPPDALERVLRSLATLARAG